MSTTNPDKKAPYFDKLPDEALCVSNLLDNKPYNEKDAQHIEQTASRWVEALRAQKNKRTLLDRFFQEYGLSNEEGVALMCLAEAFLRIPDERTAELLVQDKLIDRDWKSHIGNADSWLVNYSSWALMLTGKTLSLDKNKNPNDWLKALIVKLGQPVVQRSIKIAMQVLGGEFVLGETIQDALKRGKPSPHRLYSYDMLGEGARDRKTANQYHAAYRDAITHIGKTGYKGQSVSVKLSALHPRYHPLQQTRAEPELFDGLASLCEEAIKYDIPISIDAEESSRTQFGLDLFCKLSHHIEPAFKLGIVVQAYSKRTPAIIDWLFELAKTTKRLIPVRLVKGAYWDFEIKEAQENGLIDFPLYTRKPTTDAAYLYCAQKLLSYTDHLAPQFATHNAHTVAAILHMTSLMEKDKNLIECQRIYGMGEHLYQIVCQEHPDLRVRVYAPVGNHHDLLPYLVRRLLENGANSSFVHRLLDQSLSIKKLVRDPFDILSHYQTPRHPNIALPAQLFGDIRSNSQGLDLSDKEHIKQFWHTATEPKMAVLSSLASLPAKHINDNNTDAPKAKKPKQLSSPANIDCDISTITPLPLNQLNELFQTAQSAQESWDRQGGEQRALIFDKIADALENRRAHFYNLLCYEGGKTISDCVDEVREAVDFCRYYAHLARKHFATTLGLQGPTGELNELLWCGRGVFVCISPWNFPLAIFMGQVSAALLAGNTVIAKPSGATSRIAYDVVSLMYEMGVPKEVMQLALGGGDLGTALVKHPLCAGVAFTGSTQVARQINLHLAERKTPICPFIAETGGQNVMLVDSTALLEQVVDDVIQSSFLSSGQRCSALRILCLQEEIADEAIGFIKGAMDELVVGHPKNTSTDMGPIISQMARDQLANHIRACKEKGFEVYQPNLNISLLGHYLPPTLIEIKNLSDVTEEQFGPILHIARWKTDHIDVLINQINALGFGLTFGIHSRLQERSQYLASSIKAGNIYINRNMIGAVVASQPFGGQGLSGTGPKAGGPHYLFRFAVEKTITNNLTATGGNIALLGDLQHSDKNM